MNTNTSNTEICNLEVQIVKKDIKNIHLGVYPPDGKIRVAVPIQTTDEKIRLLINSKISWIKRQQSKFLEQERQSKREYVSGESHFFMGNRYLLTVINSNSPPRVEIKRKKRIDMYVKPQTTLKKKEQLMNAFYRSELKKETPPLIEKWEKIMGITVKEFKIKKMKTKWGTCSPKNQRIWINLELAKKPRHCLEYVLVHEMTHLIEKKHTDQFNSLMYFFIPQGAQYKQELNNDILAYSKWNNLTEPSH
ncbi:MAG: SprT family zinc-dependent metalloprotease [Candidatus Bathyarchaeia archaeon]|jgi:hypothetical protein